MICLIKYYKWNIKSSKDLSLNIEKTSAELTESLDKIQTALSSIKEAFEKLKKINPELSKLHLKVAKLKEYHPTLPEMYHDKKEESSSLIFSLKQNSEGALAEIDQAAKMVKKIIGNADALLYKESKLLDQFAKKITALKEGEKLSYHLLSRINQVKEEMKTVARRLFEEFKAEERSAFLELQKKKNISEEMGALGIEIQEVGKVLEALKIDDIDDIVKNSEKQLFNLRKVELESALVISKLERYITTLKSEMYLLPQKEKKEVDEKIESLEKKFNTIKKNITTQAEMLFQDIKIHELSHIESIKIKK